MMEPVEFKDAIEPSDLPLKPWATTGTEMKRKKNIINSLYLTPEELENLNNARYERYLKIMEKEPMYEEYQTEDADLILVAYGTIARVAMSAMRQARENGLKVGLIRPITLWPFPAAVFEKRAKTAKMFLSVEMSLGQMVEDVKLSVNGVKPVYFYGRNGGMVPQQDAIAAEVEKLLQQA